MNFNIFKIISEHLSKKEVRKLMSELSKTNSKETETIEKLEYMIVMCGLLPYREYKKFIKKELER